MLLERLINLLYPLDVSCILCGTLPPKNACLCEACLRGLPRADAVGIHAACAYAGDAKRLVSLLKFSDLRVLAAPMGRLLAEVAPSGFDALVPVPLSRRRYGERGYNQAELLALEAGSALQIPVLTALQKHRHTHTQVGLSARERMTNLKDAFSRTSVDVKGKRLLLVDDVYTTGSTCRECLRALEEGMPAAIEILVFSRAVEE